MRYTEKELAQFGCSATADFEGRLNYRPPSGNFSQSGFKERWFKLKANFLFYFRISELGVIERKEPAGVFVLENFAIQAAELTPGVPFSFSIVFRDDNERKHIFAARSEDQIERWVAAIKSCSYEHWRSQLRAMQSKIKTMTGKDPLLMYPGYSDAYASSLPMDVSALSLSPARPSRSPSNRSTSFKSHLPPQNDAERFGNPNLPNASHLSMTFQRQLHTKSDQSIPQSLLAGTIPAVTPPPRPSRAANRQRASDVPLVATRAAPPPPKSTNNLIEF